MGAAPTAYTEEYINRLLSAMRYEFGGHLEKARIGEP